MLELAHDTNTPDADELSLDQCIVEIGIERLRESLRQTRFSAEDQLSAKNSDWLEISRLARASASNINSQILIQLSSTRSIQPFFNELPARTPVPSMDIAVLHRLRELLWTADSMRHARL